VREQGQDQYRRHYGSPRGSGRVALHLNQVEGQEEQRPGQSKIEQKRESIGPGEVPRPEQRQRHHRLWAAGLYYQESS
jgi:hypothetical protein